MAASEAQQKAMEHHGDYTDYMSKREDNKRTTGVVPAAAGEHPETFHPNGPVGGQSADDHRRSSPLFANIQGYKRDSNPDAFNARTEALNESKPEKGVLGSTFDKLVKGGK